MAQLEAETAIDPDKLKIVADILKTIANPVRVGVVDLLMIHKELTVTELCEKLHIEQSLLSHHLTPMRKKGILSCKRAGKNILYSLQLMEVTHIIECMRRCKLVN